MDGLWQLVIITGAGRGFGRASAVAFAQANCLPLHLVLVARSEGELQAAKEEVLAGSVVRPVDNAGLQPVVDIYSCDLGNLDGLEASVEAIYGLVKAGGRVYDRAVFVNNAGSLGPQQFSYDGLSLSGLATAVNLNVTSACFLAADFAKRAHSGSLGPLSHASIINVSSLCAVQAIKSWAVYCSGKAARDMFHKTLAEEEEARGAANSSSSSSSGSSEEGGCCGCSQKTSLVIKILNYAPGPLDTEMQREIRESPTIDPVARAMFIDMKEKGSLVESAVSAKKMVKLMFSERFSNGAHVDFYDQIEGVDTPSAPTSCCACTFCSCGPDCKCKSVGRPLCDTCYVDISSRKK